MNSGSQLVTPPIDVKPSSFCAQWCWKTSARAP